MSDLISRQSAIEAIGDAEINFTVESNIDLSQHEEVIQQIVTNILEAQEEALRDLPSAEQEIIRCKDCKWFGKAGCAISIVDDSDRPKETDFCSFVERRTDETD